MQDILSMLLQQSIQNSPYNNSGSMRTQVSPRQLPDITAALERLKQPQSAGPMVETDTMMDPFSFSGQDMNLINQMDQQFSGGPSLNIQPQPMASSPPVTSQSVQEWLGAKAPSEGGLIENILRGRGRPSLGDWADSVAQTATTGKPVSSQGIADERLSNSLSKLADIQKLSATGQGGATGALVQQYMDSTGSDFPTALYAVQTGMRQGLGYDNGIISPLPGVPQAKGDIAYGEQMGTNRADVQTAAQESLESGRGKNAAEIELGQGKKGVSANATLGLVQQARDYLAGATSGPMENIGSTLDRWKGKSTVKTQSDAQLKVIAAGLTSNVPRMEGPQSNYDVQLYREAAADVGNPLISVGDRMAALDTIEALQMKYADAPQDLGTVPMPPNPDDPLGLR